MSDRADNPVAKSGVIKLFPTCVWATQLKPEVFEPINAQTTVG